jgi:4'-phosphopantetheinyl transferase
MEALQIAFNHLSATCLADPPVPPLLSSRPHVWEFPLTVAESDFANAAELLSTDERTRAAKFHFARDARRFTVARARLRSILAKYATSSPRDLRFAVSEHGKPSLAGAPSGLFFNLSHSGDRGLLGVALKSEIGVDVEQIKPGIEFDKLAGRFFSTREREFLSALSPEQKALSFFRCWTCKEAFLKAEGIGLSRGLASFDIDLSTYPARLVLAPDDPAKNQQWSLIELEASPGYAAAAVIEHPVRTLSFFRCD